MNEKDKWLYGEWGRGVSLQDVYQREMQRRMEMEKLCELQMYRPANYFGMDQAAQKVMDKMPSPAKPTTNKLLLLEDV